ncbi:MAG: phytanoyl-CoA dioxygenase family protein [Abditibacteriales bacterium]|nr:phytanoyl-CoA dioxygenase family protein [Abditibacteriales bacterium]
MGMTVSSEQLQKYQQDGYAIFPSVLDADLIQEASDHVEWLQKKHPQLRPEALHHWLMWDDPFWLRLIADDRLLDIVEAFIGPNIALFASHYICKPGGDGLPVLWHQDGYYWPLEPMEVITVWLTVDDSDRENGCMRVIPGTHRPRTLYPHIRATTEAVLSQELEAHFVDDSKAVDVEVPRGGISVHDPFLIHGSNPNRSSRRRCGLTIRYIPTSTKITREDWKTFLLRGTDTHHKNVYSPFPPFRPGDHFPFRDLATYRGGVA